MVGRNETGMSKLSARKVASIKEPGMHGDGQGLYLSVSRTGSKSWILRTRVKGEKSRREIGLGSALDVSLADARDKARELRSIARQGNNPIPKRDEKTWTFEAAARAVHANLAPTFHSPKHAALWISSIERYAFPKLGDRDIATIRRPDVIEVLSPIWTTKSDTARRVKQRIGSVFSWAIGNEIYTHPQPVDDALMKALPKVERVTEHRAAMPWKEVPGFYVELEEREAVSAVCLRFLLLTALRSVEVRGARWNEFDLANSVWNVPGARMKEKVAHRVPLSREAIDLLRSLEGLGEDFVFPAPQRAKGGKEKMLSVNAFRPLQARMGRTNFTVHGFRSSFRDWASEVARVDRTVAEAALAHKVTGVEGAYARSDLFDRRRELMEAWSRFVTGVSGEVVELVRA